MVTLMKELRLQAMSMTMQVYSLIQLEDKLPISTMLNKKPR